MLAWILQLWPCVCLCLRLCLSVTSQCSIEMDESIELVLACRLLSTYIYPTLRCKKIQVSTKMRVLSFWNFVPNSGRRKFCFDISIVETCYRLSSRKVDAQSVINWTVVGQLSWQYLRAPTLNHCSLSRDRQQHDLVARVNHSSRPFSRLLLCTLRVAR